MIIRAFLLTITLAMSCVIDADVSYWDQGLVRPYVHNSELQRRWAWSFVAEHLKGLKGDEHILDLGCGDGKISADISKFVPEGKVDGVDLSTPMIAWAKRQYHPLEYPNLSFYEGSFQEPNLSGPYDLIVSFCALQHCSDIPTAIANMNTLLKPHGKALVLVPIINPAWKQARTHVQSLPKWSGYFQNYVPRQFLTAEQYRELFTAAGMHSIEAVAVNTMDPFVDREELITWLQGTFTPMVPQEHSREFYNEWMDEYLRLLPEALGPDGVIYAKMGVVTIRAQK